MVRGWALRVNQTTDAVREQRLDALTALSQERNLGY